MRVLKSDYGKYAVHAGARVVRIVRHTRRRVVVEEVDPNNAPRPSYYDPEGERPVLGQDLDLVSTWLRVIRDPEYAWHERRLALLRVVDAEIAEIETVEGPEAFS